MCLVIAETRGLFDIFIWAEVYGTFEEYAGFFVEANGVCFDSSHKRIYAGDRTSLVESDCQKVKSRLGGCQKNHDYNIVSKVRVWC